MNPNPYQTPEPLSDQDHDGRPELTIELFSVMLWSNLGLIAVYLLFSGMDWMYVNWGTRDARVVNMAWSKLFFILIGANVIIYFTYTNRHTGQTTSQITSHSSDELVQEKRQQ